MAPEETMMTLWPSFRNLTAVSTIRVKMDRIGSCVFSSTMELVPTSLGGGKGGQLSVLFTDLNTRRERRAGRACGLLRTELNDNPEGAGSPHS